MTRSVGSPASGGGGTRSAGPTPSRGPTGRWADSFEPWGQLLVSRGYVVMYPNVRGSTGYGHRFVEMNRGDWGGGDFKDVMAVVEPERSQWYQSNGVPMTDEYTEAFANPLDPRYVKSAAVMTGGIPAARIRTVSLGKENPDRVSCASQNIGTGGDRLEDQEKDGRQPIARPVCCAH